ncbi:MAG: hypothetical protein L6R41_003656 [Letrouitia leprolyta]|nr:MAG: hypothetical protein L6R41_003656 [Letrouitia leprolyta]
MPGPPSAIVGRPPLTEDDTLIVHGWQVLFGMGQVDPSKGLKIAIKAPPPGQPHDSDSTSIAVGCAVSLALMTLFTGTRLFLRASHKSLVWGWDDWAILFGTLLAMTTPIFYCYKLVNAGAERHVYDVTYWELANHQSVVIAAFALFYVALAFIKISIVLFYMRLTAFASRNWMIAHKMLMVFLLICATISLFITVFECDPPIYSNIREIGRRNTKPKCMKTIDIIIGFNAWHILTDCLLLVVPFLMLWRVQMKLSTKLKVCLAGVIGFANVGLALARTIVQATAKQKGFDLTYSATSSFAYSASELTLAVITANLPVLSFMVTKTVEMLSWSSISSDRSPDRANGQKRFQGSNFYKRRLHDESETEFSGLRGTHTSESRPTIRHDVEYGPTEAVEVQQMGLVKDH